MDKSVPQTRQRGRNSDSMVESCTVIEWHIEKAHPLRRFGERKIAIFGYTEKTARFIFKLLLSNALNLFSALLFQLNYCATPLCRECVGDAAFVFIFSQHRFRG